MSSITVDPAEVAAFNRLAETWWDTSGPMWPLHRLNALRRDYLAERLRAYWPDLPAERPLEAVETLDIGCGAGLLSESMARFGARVHGVDVAERNIAIARKHASTENLDIEYDTATAESLVTQGRRYDLVLNMEVVEHVADLPAFLSACCQLTRPGGVMVISTINRTLASWVTAIIGAEYILRWLPRGTHQWSRFPKPGELETILAANDFAVEDRVGVGVNPLNRKFRLHRYLGVNYMLITRRKA
ncbi:MAG: bifunctional 2-polyprenyl-6-hydroxyphenol methylase/3-demethylubiquinol 3-O-methyltransferase UbiG [Gammaproteobacteria bacterium]|jgi:2-polyprenyl-6-hydroxyphenyl methylase/3-demethylubiquinone-9 3-methyltransferase